MMIERKAESHKQSQRERILEAAKRRFVQSGFHSASMATISETAGMSPGLIYRYFENKKAIILAIVEAELETVQRRLCDMPNTDDLASSLVDYFESYDEERYDSVSAPLFLEISAEAARDPEIAEAVSRIDDIVRDAIADWFHRSREEGGYGLPVEAARDRALALIFLVDGLKVRKAREPGIDRRRLRNAIDLIVAALPGL